MDANKLRADNADGGDNASTYQEMMHGSPGKEEEFDAYARAIYHLEAAGATSEFHKPAEFKQEIDLMREANQVATRRNYSIPWNKGQFERIFRATGERIDLNDQNCGSSTL